MSSWRELKLGDICTDISYGYTASAKSENVGPKFLRITDIVPDRITWGNVPFCEIDDKKKEQYKLEVGDIVIARTGATTGYNKVIKDDIDSVFASYLIRYKIDKQQAFPAFIGYSLQSYEWKGFVEGIIGGSAQPGANAKQFASYDILLPPLEEQKAIAEVLSSLDDKIDLLHRQNQTLESIAQTLFRQWFIEEAKEEWEDISLDKCCIRITKGTTPTTLKKQFVESGINFIKVNCIDEKGSFLKDKFDFIDDETNELLNRSKLEKGDILYSIAGTIGRLAMVNDELLPANVNQALAILRVDKSVINPYFVKYCLLDKDITFELHSKIVHAVQPNLSLGEISNTLIPYPSKEILDSFSNQIESIEEKINQNKKQIQTLENLRDALLPKLLSGEVRVER